jgi:glycosyltransferase involved in cell wall biosynthesis
MPDVEIFENVPETRPFFEQSSLLLYAPSRGSGMKVKVLEAMAFGLPVVTTSEGVEGLNARDGVHAGIAEDDAGLVDRSVALLTDTTLQNSLRRAARRLIEVECDPSRTLDIVEGIYSRVLTFAGRIPARRGFA